MAGDLGGDLPVEVRSGLSAVLFLGSTDLSPIGNGWGLQCGGGGDRAGVGRAVVGCPKVTSAPAPCLPLLPQLAQHLALSSAREEPSPVFGWGERMCPSGEAGGVTGFGGLGWAGQLVNSVHLPPSPGFRGPTVLTFPSICLLASIC